MNAAKVAPRSALGGALDADAAGVVVDAVRWLAGGWLGTASRGPAPVIIPSTGRMSTLKRRSRIAFTMYEIRIHAHTNCAWFLQQNRVESDQEHELQPGG